MGVPVAVKKGPRVNYVSSGAAVLACGELPPVVFCDSRLNTLNGRKKTSKGSLKEPVIATISFSLFVKYRVICSLKKNTTTALAQNLSGDTRQPRS